MSRLLQIPTISTDSIPDISTELSKLSTLSIDDLIERLVDGAVELAINVAIAVAIFYAGKFIIRKIHRIVEAILTRRKAEKSLSTFILSLINIALYFVLVVTVIGVLGIETSSFIAIFASAGVAIGMALSGTLQNFAGGVLILLLKPYKVGDFIEAQGYSGTVAEIQIFHTIINTFDNQSIIIPNGGLSTGSINNYSREKYRRVAWNIDIAYGDNIDNARKAILDILATDNRIPQAHFDDDPNKTTRTPTVVVKDLGASGVRIQASAWVHSCEYWNVFHDIIEKIYNDLPAAGINFPFPQMDVHISNN